jgi:hypothetical protein
MPSKKNLTTSTSIALILFSLSANAANVRFCYENTSDWGRPYYPKFTINGNTYYLNYDHKLNCFDLGNIPDATISLTTNGFSMDYKNNIISFNGNICGFGTPCVIPAVYQNEELYYIHASVWPLDDKNLTGILTAVYKPTDYGTAPGEVLGRDLDVPGMGWIGHVAYPLPQTPAIQVIEVLNENAVIQINTIQSFKSKSKYWGSRWGLIPGTESQKENNALKILREGVSQMGFCPIYTSTAQYKVGTPTSCAMFRCDTFVNHIYKGGIGINIIPDGDAILPTKVFNAFPRVNPDEHPGLSKSKTVISYTNNLSSMTAKKLSEMSQEDFMIIINAPIDNISEKEINAIWKFAQDSSLSVEKRTLLMDKLGFIGRVDMLSLFTAQYFKMDDNKIKSMLLRSTLTLYQKYFWLKEYPKEKEILQKFYMQLLETKLSANDASIVIRGFIQLNNSDVVLAHINRINMIFNSQEVNLDPYVSVGLKLELAFKSKELENIYISDIIGVLKKENNPQLENLLNQFIVRRLSGLGISSLEWQSKNLLQIYLDSVRYKYIHSNKEKIESPMPEIFYGTWLEALALVASNSFEGAGQYIANFMQDKNPHEQIIYVSGLSNSEYMKKAFNTYPVLINFKNKNQHIYRDSVGAPIK